MEKEQYELILGLLADKIKEQDKTIGIQDWQIRSLTKQLEEAKALLLKKETYNKGVHNEIQN